jgi:hypothetical protein
VRFARDGVELERTDPPNPSFPQGLKAIIKGPVSNERNGLSGGKIQWTVGQSGTFDARMSWGTGLDAIPGEDGPGQVAGDQSLMGDLLMLMLAASFSSDSDSDRPRHACTTDFDCRGGRCVHEDFGLGYMHTWCER